MPKYTIKHSRIGVKSLKYKVMIEIKEGDVLTLEDGTKATAIKSSKSTCEGCIFTTHSKGGMAECGMADAMGNGKVYRCWDGETEFIFKKKEE